MAKAGKRRRLGGVRRWCSDALRLPAALVLLNARKTAWRWHGRRHGKRPPCQHPSDNGCAGQTHCDGVANWYSPHRFRRVCPALRVTPQGCLCSLDAPAVRPFWGRAIGYYVGTAMAVFIVAVGVTFGALRAIGLKEVAVADVAWPGRWSRINHARSRYFAAQGIQALGAGNFELARLALNSAVEIDPDNYDAGLLLVMLSSVTGNPRLADVSFQWLISAHPEQATRSAVMFHDALLAQGRLDELAEFSLWMVPRDPTNTAVWVRSLLAALRVGGNASNFAQAHAKTMAALPPAARSLIAIEILIQEGRTEPARLALRRPLDSAQPVYGLQQVDQLLRLGDLPSAVLVKNALPPLKGELYSLGLQYLIEKQYGDDAFAHSCFGALAVRELTPEQLDWVVALLVRAPDAASFALLDGRLRTRERAALRESTVASLWLAAVRCGDTAAVTHWADDLQQRAHITVPRPLKLDFASLSPRVPGTVPAVLNLVALPRETIFALLAQVQRPVRGQR